MKKIIILMTICASLFAQQGQLVSWNRMYKPKLDKRDAFIKAVSDKTKKYNSKKGTQVIRTYEVINGPNVGSFVVGPIEPATNLGCSSVLNSLAAFLAIFAANKFISWVLLSNPYLSHLNRFN